MGFGLFDEQAQQQRGQHGAQVFPVVFAFVFAVVFAIIREENVAELRARKPKPVGVTAIMQGGKLTIRLP